MERRQLESNSEDWREELNWIQVGLTVRNHEYHPAQSKGSVLVETESQPALYSGI
jgi:hypothetical protein